MTFRAMPLTFLSVALVAILAFGSLAHAFLPHQHSTNEGVTSLLHSALRHEDKQVADLVPLAPTFVAVVVALIAVFFAQAFLVRGFLVRAPALLPLRRGIVPYRRFD